MAVEEGEWRVVQIDTSRVLMDRQVIMSTLRNSDGDQIRLAVNLSDKEFFTAAYIQPSQVIEIVQILLELLAKIRAKAHITED